MLVPILLYHSISDNADPGYRKWSLSPQLFSAHLSYLRSAGYTPLTVTQFVELITSGDKLIPVRPIVLTFDGGQADFYHSALPILVQHEFVATLYVVTGYIGGVSQWLSPTGAGSPAMMSWTQIAKLPMVGIEVGAHTHTHPQLDTLAYAEARYEIVRSKTILEQKLGRRVASFAYPDGYYTQNIRNLVQEAGFLSACTTKQALSSASADPFTLSRLTITADMDVEHLRQLLNGQSLSTSFLQERVQAQMSRFLRRSQKWLTLF